jgi:L-alanine-DL-glutamate epimerase-like enolase superfamily enzyme
MRIARIQAIPLRVRQRRVFKSSLGTRAESLFGIVLVESDSGQQGVGEISMLWNGGGAGLCSTVEDLLAPGLIGGSPFDINWALAKMDQAVQFWPAANPAKAAVEMALYDLVGRTLNTPVCNLLGGRSRQRAMVEMPIFMDGIDAMVEQARQIVSQGFRAVKIKIGEDADQDVAVVRAIREAMGENLIIRVDANMGWQSVKEALGVLSRLAPLNIHSVEQPLPRERLEDLAALRGHSPVPVMVDESVWGPDDAERVLRARAADIINVYVSEAGGLRNSLRIFAMAEMAGVQCTIGCMGELGIGTAACAHLGISVPVLCEPADIRGFLLYEDSLIQERWEIRDGCIDVPHGPGLGVTLDRARLAELQIEDSERLISRLPLR